MGLTELWPIIVAAVFGYVLGSIPFGVVITRLAGLGDIRAVGSGNIGATNVLRTGKKGLAAATLLGDALKATLAIVIAAQWGEGPALAAAFGAFMGHLFPVWLSFKGGKGVATFLGCLIALNMWVALFFAVVWLAVAYFSKFSSLAALIASAFVAPALLIADQPAAATLFAILTIFLWAKHRGNIVRLMTGQESRIGSKS
ncbi:MAG: glycerol-3-phosphate 1-O-acyltransferase PlsY [Chelatococcus sp.]|jgi:glycerol-3-phosphate acyltransferase PlsY|uniref:glycerol-3-phosphate 1-O-acyltransferase PlsY n=1 Tax=unclassified Chelatococcus TaxID=2638111 RepID=UPI001BCB6D9B|nr:MULTISPECIES: glycerol-3-phosphate 1-O-acyltransferase PlsY [unclassified Chelatococcus]CAH1669681.1 Glycerol-3-phosphate acyltransferase [Hyphomicrobiales bacterium]MBS7738239.1 glycerol-3-phosphate 1-O-acyltransferase PlsY [Chelatococcus sp. HY11]MBX3539661.1 glycerol-3-phosphate 1-O-acyltransferase PlsY [Chelatococcus sp.]MBX3545767.1 glycerol-3-phosphate 1-O-acyltransferase PlsY [Chelatococcus sp.]MCO5077415.1 glycerol-3-phosphate 1-O-acyltransferase PlsY [Chelatococcus sp.]